MPVGVADVVAHERHHVRDHLIEHGRGDQGQAGTRRSSDVPRVLLLLFALLQRNACQWLPIVAITFGEHTNLLCEALHENGNEELHGSLDVVQAGPRGLLLDSNVL